MSLWAEVIAPLQSLRPAFSTCTSFYWFVLAVASFCCGMGTQASVCEMLRTLQIDPRCYNSFLRFFCSNAIDHQRLRDLWVKLLLQKAKPYLLAGRVLLVIDEKKMAKEGRKMPGSRVHHQSSTNNSKPSYIMGHNIMSIGLMVQGARKGAAVMIPLMFKILGGIRYTPRDKSTCFDHSVKAILELVGSLGKPVTIVADALYCVKPFARRLYHEWVHTISRVKGNGAASYPPRDEDYKGRGRRPKYGKGIKLRQQFGNTEQFTKAQSPIPGEEKVQLSYLQLHLIPKWFGKLANFVLVSHPKRGNIILFCTDLSLDWEEVYLAYYHRFKIELSFKSLVYDIGAFFYRFWCKSMKKIKIGDKERYVHKEKKETVEAIKVKIRAYEFFLMAGGIAYGLMQWLSLSKPAAVWSAFKGWIRTIRPGSAPSIKTCSKALSDGVLDFFHTSLEDEGLAKFYRSKYRQIDDTYEKCG